MFVSPMRVIIFDAIVLVYFWRSLTLERTLNHSHPDLVYKGGTPPSCPQFYKISLLTLLNLGTFLDVVGRKDSKTFLEHWVDL